ncbi:3-oxoacyl-acyl-carrier-protein reductase FabG (plasmid) [Burkholderia sp. AD24]|nr:3-oxoacyl-acyl-carrier-protein reductase FabG [Burkholderia sp. AD24]
MESVNPSLRGKVALVTGGAGALGTAICKALAAQGANVIVGFRSATEPGALVAQLSADHGQRHRALRCDVVDAASLRELAASIDGDFGRLDMLVNCAGITRYVPHTDLDALDDTLIDAILTTNVRCAIACTRALRDLLARGSDGLIVNISSIAARTGVGSNIAYCASKAALDNLTLSLARALAPAIRVVSVAPGLADTDFVKGMDPAWRHEQTARTPLGRLASTAEIADAVTACALQLRFMTGAILPIDGGRTLL